MTNASKIKVCKMRLQGKSIHAIADKIGVTPQTVSNFLRTLPTCGTRVNYPDLPTGTIYSICNDYIHGLAIRAIALKNGIAEQAVYECLWYITARRPIPVKTSAYPSLTNWMQTNLHSLKTLADELDISPNTLGQIVAGKAHLLYDLAVKIRDVTGLSLVDIFEGGKDSYERVTLLSCHQPKAQMYSKAAGGTLNDRQG